MPVDTSMYSTLGQNNNAMQTLSGVVNAARGIQDIQSQKLQQESQRNQNVQTGIDAQEMQSLQPVLRNVQEYTDARGNIDFNKFVPMVMQAAPKNGASVIQNMATAQQQRTAAQNAISGQSANALQRASQAIFSIDPTKATPEMLQQTAEALNKNFTDPQAQDATTQLFNAAAKVVAGTKPEDPLRATNLQHLAMMYQPIESQQQIGTPTPVQLNNNQQSWLQNIKPGIAGLPQNQPIPNTAVQQQLSPSTPVMEGNTPGYLGPQMGGTSPTGSQQKAGFVAAGLPVGAENNIAANVNTMNKHFESLQDSAAGNQLAQGLVGNIQSLATKAITGTESDKLAYANGLLAALPGNGHSDNIKTATDLLEKNMAQLNLSSPASSDAARVLISAARPHSTMSPDAIKEASQQLAAQVQANVAIRDHLARYKYANGGQGDATGYQQERQNIESVADPRAWQYMDLGPGTPAAKSFIQHLSPSDRAQLGTKIQKLEQLGILK
jgi:hypothetical protein